MHTTPEKLENAASFQSAAKQSFSKTLFKPGDLKTSALRFRVKGNVGCLRDVISLTQFTSNTNPKRPVTDAFLNSFGVVLLENI